MMCLLFVFLEGLIVAQKGSMTSAFGFLALLQQASQMVWRVLVASLDLLHNLCLAGGLLSLV
jgi:hypothetical protein